jgi:hypothetical protein
MGGHPDLRWRNTIDSNVGSDCLDHVDKVMHVQVKLLSRQQSQDVRHGFFQHVECVKRDAFVPE